MLRWWWLAVFPVLAAASMAAADPAEQKHAMDWLDRQSGLRSDVVSSTEYEMTVGGLPMGSGTIAISHAAHDGQPCYRLEVQMKATFGERVSEQAFHSLITPDLRALTGERTESEDGAAVLTETITLGKDGVYKSVTTTAGEPEETETFAHQRGLLHSGMEVLLAHLIDRSPPRAYEFTHHEEGLDPQISRLIVGEATQKTYAGQPHRVTPVTSIMTPGPGEERFQFLFTDDGRLIEWSGGDPEMPIIFLSRDVAGAGTAPLDLPTVRRLARPVDPVLVHFHAIVEGDAATATAVVDAGRFAHYLVANDPQLDASSLADGVASGAASDAIAQSVSGWPDDALAMLKLVLAEGTFVVREQDGGFARVTFNDELRGIPGLDRLEFLVEQDPGSGKWFLVMLGEAPLKRAPAR